MAVVRCTKIDGKFAAPIKDGKNSGVSRTSLRATLPPTSSGSATRLSFRRSFERTALKSFVTFCRTPSPQPPRRPHPPVHDDDDDGGKKAISFLKKQNQFLQNFTEMRRPSPIEWHISVGRG